MKKIRQDMFLLQLHIWILLFLILLIIVNRFWVILQGSLSLLKYLINYGRYCTNIFMGSLWKSIWSIWWINIKIMKNPKNNNLFILEVFLFSKVKQQGRGITSLTLKGLPSPLSHWTWTSLLIHLRIKITTLALLVNFSSCC